MKKRVTIEVPNKFYFVAEPEWCEEEKASVAALNGEIDEGEFTRRLLAARDARRNTKNAV